MAKKVLEVSFNPSEVKDKDGNPAWPDEDKGNLDKPQKEMKVLREGKERFLVEISEERGGHTCDSEKPGWWVRKEFCTITKYEGEETEEERKAELKKAEEALEKAKAELKVKAEEAKKAEEERKAALKKAEEENRAALKRAEEESKAALKRADEDKKAAIKAADEEKKAAIKRLEDESKAALKKAQDDLERSREEVKKAAEKLNVKPKIESKAESEGVSMSSTFSSMVLSDAQEAAYMVAGEQITKAVRMAALKITRDQLEKKYGSGKRAQGKVTAALEGVETFLDSDIGMAAISSGIGYGLTYIPQLKDNVRAQTLAQKMRVGGMAKAGNAVISAAMDHVGPAIMGIMNTLPSPGETANFNIDALLPKEEKVVETVSAGKSNARTA